VSSHAFWALRALSALAFPLVKFQQAPTAVLEPWSVEATCRRRHHQTALAKLGTVSLLALAFQLAMTGQTGPAAVAVPQSEVPPLMGASQS
jgi:hypothetical protein